LPIIFSLAIQASFAEASSNSEIESFSRNICGKMETSGSFTKSTLDTTIKGDIKGLAKVVGLSAAANGSFVLEKEHYIGLPYKDLPDQLKDALDCRKELAILLLKERFRVAELLSALCKGNDPSIDVYSSQNSWSTGALISSYLRSELKCSVELREQEACGVNSEIQIFDESTERFANWIQGVILQIKHLPVNTEFIGANAPNSISICIK
jgi:hypothetical protein